MKDRSACSQYRALLKRGLLRESPDRDRWQAGRSVARIERLGPAGMIVRRLAEAWRSEAARP